LLPLSWCKDLSQYQKRDHASMGIVCSACAEKRPQHRSVKSSAVKAPRARVYPLLCHLEEDFKAMADEKGQIGPQELAQLWENSAQRKAGKLSKEDLKIIHEDSQTFFSEMDLEENGTVDFDEFATFMLGGNAERGNFRTMRTKLHQCVTSDPRILSEVIQFFRKWDKDGKGFLSRKDIQDHLTELKDLIDRVHAETASAVSIASNASTRSATHHLRHKKSNKKPLRKCGDGSVPSMVEELHAILGEADAGPDDKIDLWELLAHVLGRRRTPVELLLYDISDGIADHYSTLLLGIHFEAIYHTGIVAFGYEYWYGGSIFRLDPPSFSTPPLTKSILQLRPSAYDPNLRTVHLGYTLATEEEFSDFLDKHILDRYTRETYDVLTHNCNCFTNEAAHYLLGAPIPEEISSLPQVAMNTPMARTLRPFLNHWLGG